MLGKGYPGRYDVLFESIAASEGAVELIAPEGGGDGATAGSVGGVRKHQ